MLIKTSAFLKFLHLHPAYAGYIYNLISSSLAEKKWNSVIW
jgi:hypothetical protein